MKLLVLSLLLGLAACADHGPPLPDGPWQPVNLPVSAPPSTSNALISPPPGPAGESR